MGRKKTYCATCDWELNKFTARYPRLHKDNVLNVQSTKKYCDEHEKIYGDECEPRWCDECGHLEIYQVTVTEKSRKKTPKFDRKNR